MPPTLNIVILMKIPDWAFLSIKTMLHIETYLLKDTGLGTDFWVNEICTQMSSNPGCNSNFFLEGISFVRTK